MVVQVHLENKDHQEIKVAQVHKVQMAQREIKEIQEIMDNLVIRECRDPKEI